MCEVQCFSCVRMRACVREGICLCTCDCVCVCTVCAVCEVCVMHCVMCVLYLCGTYCVVYEGVLQ